MAGTVAGSLFLSCTEKEAEIAVSSVSISQPTAEMLIGETVKLSAIISPSNATSKEVVWASSKQSVATVSQDGLVTAITEGTSNITATAGGKVGSCVVTVSKGVITVTSIELNKSSLELVEGDSATLSATVKPDDATDKTVTWTTSDASIVTVDGGKVKAQKEGQAIITAKAGDKTATCTVVVTKKVIPVTSISLDNTSLSLKEGQEAQLIATVKPDDATDKTVSWNSDKTNVATVDNTGKVKAIAEGTAIITAKAGDKTATCTVVVSKNVIAVTSITLDKTTLSLIKGEEVQLVATVKPDNATDKTVTWTTSDASIVTVNAGRIKAVKSGNASIIAKAGDKTATCVITVTTPVESITLDATSATLEEGQSITLIATINPSDADEKTVTWSTSNETVASVSNGKVTANKEGTATITAKAGSKSATCTVTVYKKAIAVTSITLNKTTLSLTKGQNETLIATVKPDNATDKTVTWTSSDSSVATVDQNGKVTAMKSGKASITAKAGEKSTSCDVTVTTPVGSITLDRATASLEEGQSLTLVATISPADADDKTITWTSSNSAVATVSNGLVKALTEGTAIISASAGGKSASCTITVLKQTIAVTSITLNKSTLNLTKGQNETLIATVKPDNATDKTVSWSSSDSSVASVTQDGCVTAQKSGTATITAKAGDKNASCTVIVTTPVESVSLNSSSVTLEEGQTFTLVATINPNDADDKTVIWETTKASVATVSNGLVTAIAEGTATITATVGGKSASCSIAVSKKVIPVSSITIEEADITIEAEVPYSLHATISPSNATEQVITWSSSNSTIASVNNSGVVTGHKSGNVTITASCGDKSATCKVTVVISVSSVVLNKSSVKIRPNETYQLIATVNPSNATEQTITWTSNLPGIATVDSSGLVKGISVGEATITASCGGKSATATITVATAESGESEDTGFENWE